MNTELDRLIAQQACRDLVLAAADAVDQQDYAALAALFAPDGVLLRPDGSELRGPAAIEAAYAARDPDRLTRHLVCNQRVSVDLSAGTARATCSVQLWTGRHSAAPSPRGRAADPVQQVGHIHDQYVLTPAGWRIQRREAWFTLVRDTAAA